MTLKRSGQLKVTHDKVNAWKRRAQDKLRTKKPKKRYTGASVSVLASVRRRSGGYCERCRFWLGREMHHRLPRKMGGRSKRNPLINIVENIVHLCDNCHRWIESNRAEAYATGWLLHEGEDPREIPWGVRRDAEHPAKYSTPILDLMTEQVKLEAERLGKRLSRIRILDPMAGVGRVHQLPGLTYGAELEPEWAAQSRDRITWVGSCLNMPWNKNSFDVIAVSPCYGNRLADHHDAKDDSRRHSYTHTLGRKLSPGNAGVMPFRDDQPLDAPYRRFHRAAWREATRVLRPDGLFLLNVSNFYVRDRVQHVVEWHGNVLLAMGYTLEAIHEVATPRLRHGANRKRAESEIVLQLRAPA